MIITAFVAIITIIILHHCYRQYAHSVVVATIVKHFPHRRGCMIIVIIIIVVVVSIAITIIATIIIVTDACITITVVARIIVVITTISIIASTLSIVITWSRHCHHHPRLHYYYCHHRRCHHHRLSITLVFLTESIYVTLESDKPPSIDLVEAGAAFFDSASIR